MKRYAINELADPAVQSAIVRVLRSDGPLSQLDQQLLMALFDSVPTLIDVTHRLGLPDAEACLDRVVARAAADLAEGRLIDALEAELGAICDGNTWAAVMVDEIRERAMRDSMPPAVQAIADEALELLSAALTRRLCCT